MESLPVSLNQVELFDAAVHGTIVIPALKEGCDLRIITKDNATSEGRAAAMMDGEGLAYFRWHALNWPEITGCDLNSCCFKWWKNGWR